LFRFTTIKDYHNNLQSGQTTVVEAVRFFVEAAKGAAPSAASTSTFNGYSKIT